MFITTEDILDYLCNYCDDAECPWRNVEACPDECPVAIACRALVAREDNGLVFDTEKPALDTSALDVV